MGSPSADRVELKDPRLLFKQPPFRHQEQTKLPGTLNDMHPHANHGEESYRGMGRLAGLNALITGGDSGIGRAVAIAFAREGANVAISYLNEDEDARQTVDWIRQAGCKGIAIPGDIAIEAHCTDVVQQCVDELGGIDILVNNAAHQELRDQLDDFSTELFDRIFKTNVYATFWFSRAAIKHLPPGGSIINTASIQAFDPSAPLLAYAATKATLVNLTKGLAGLVIKQGVRVNAVAPGPVWTPLIPASMPPEKIQKFGGNTVFERPAQPAELAPLYVWLASPEASYVTGEVFGATGGRSPV